MPKTTPPRGPARRTMREYVRKLKALIREADLDVEAKAQALREAQAKRHALAGALELAGKDAPPDPDTPE